MTSEERLNFCGHTAMAARRLGIHGKEEKSESGEPVFRFFDPMAKVAIKGAPAPDRMDAFKNACETLVKYLDVKQ